MVVFQGFMVQALSVLSHFLLLVLEEDIIASLGESCFESILVKIICIPYVIETRLGLIGPIWMYSFQCALLATWTEIYTVSGSIFQLGQISMLPEVNKFYV